MRKRDKGLNTFSLTMLALGTVIGGSFFLGIAFPIKTSGPSVLLVFLYCGLLIYFILYSLSELTVNDPTPGSFRIYAQRAYGHGMGFVVGWVYWVGLTIGMSSEAVAVSVLFQVFLPNVAISVIGSIVIVAVVGINLLGTDKLSFLENTLAGIKILAVAAFIVIAALIIAGLIGKTPVGLGEIPKEPFFNAGVPGILGSALIVMFAYAGFEIIGLASTETVNPGKTVPRAILFTVLGLVILYCLAVGGVLPLLPISDVSENTSPFVAALLKFHIDFAAKAINIVLIIAILSTMLASLFGLARTIRSLANDNYAPRFLKEKGDIPYKGIIASGVVMFLFFSLSFFLPKKVYLFLVSSSGFSLLFTYLIIVLSHYKYRKRKGCEGNKCQLPFFPVSSWFSVISLLVIIAAMPLVKGQGAGLIVGISFIVIFTLAYVLFFRKRIHSNQQE